MVSLNDKIDYKWTMWAHLPHDTDWSIESYKKIYDISTVKESLSLIETIPDILVKNCMLFLMREGVKPVWEDVANRAGGCFSYKVNNKNVFQCWKELCYVTLGSSISKNEKFIESVSGITISPKKNFCIIKIWMSNCNYKNPLDITNVVSELNANGCIFKEHVPEY